MITYRRLKVGDIPVMINLWKACGLPIREKGRESRKSLSRELKRYPRNFIGALDGEKLVGVVIATSDGRKGWVNRLAVHPSCRRRGIALKLIRKAEKELRARGIKIFSALIERDNESSLVLFEKAGYDLHDDIAYVRKELVKGA